MSQINEIYLILQDKLPHRSDEFQTKLFGSTKVGLFRLGARIYDLRKRGFDIRGWKDPKVRSLYWYQLIGSENAGFEARDEIEARQIAKEVPFCCESGGIFKDKFGQPIHSQECLKTKEKAGKLFNP